MTAARKAQTGYMHHTGKKKLAIVFIFRGLFMAAYSMSLAHADWLLLAVVDLCVASPHWPVPCIYLCALPRINSNIRTELVAL